MSIPVSNMPVADVRVFSVVHVLIDICFFSSESARTPQSKDCLGNDM